MLGFSLERKPNIDQALPDLHSRVSVKYLVLPVLRFARTQEMSGQVKADDFVPLRKRHLIDRRVLLKVRVIN